MTTQRRKEILEKRSVENEKKLPIIEVFKDNEMVLTTNIVFEAVTWLRTWLLKTPFWDITQVKVFFYKDPLDNVDFQDRENKRESLKLSDSGEKNLMIKDDKRKYTCLRCGFETEVCGFCSRCYPKVYGLDKIEEIEVPLDEIKCNPRFGCVLENDPEYSNKIKQSIIDNGMKNPIIIDEENRILIGHHRYYIAKELGWKTIKAKINPISFGFGYFYEGKGHNLFICRVDDKLKCSSTEAEDVISLIMDFESSKDSHTLEAEFFLNIGSDIRMRNVFIPERGHIVDQTWLEWWINKFGKEPR